jgi:hypothetical protein
MTLYSHRRQTPLQTNAQTPMSSLSDFAEMRPKTAFYLNLLLDRTIFAHNFK